MPHAARVPGGALCGSLGLGTHKGSEFDLRCVNVFQALVGRYADETPPFS